MKLMKKQPPVNGNRTAREKDEKILAAMVEPSRPVEIAERVGMPLSYVHTRLSQMVKRGDAQRIFPVGAPTNGPGASLYEAVQKI